MQELGSFLALETREELVVDRSAQGELLRINFNISYPSLSCEFATLDVSDALGTVRRPPSSPESERERDITSFPAISGLIRCVEDPF